MQDPSQGVAQPLQNHVHLISSHRFPLVASLSLEQAFRYLIDAPQIVKQIAAMSWTYVQAPQDGTLWLEWLSPGKNDNRFPSDGYVWADQEQTFRQDCGGYTIEVMMHTIGYRYQYDHMSSHARTRYHFVAKNPSVNAAPPDPLLWIVHYHQADPQRMLPSNQIPPNTQMQQVLNERNWLERQGRLDKRDFMLHDREHWPTISVPNSAHLRQMQQPGMYGAPPAGSNAMGRPPPYPQPSHPQQPPQKKQRQTGPAVLPGGPVEHDTSIEDEENTTLGDFFDHLTPREISMARYMQHHRWMEEVFSSPYASNQIVPADLGLGLIGELKGLTEGLLEPPSLDSLDRMEPRPPKAKEAQPFTNLKKEQIEEFNRRVEKHLEEGQAEIERIKTEHTAKMQEWKKTKMLMQAEKRLRLATWEGHENGVAAYRLDAPPVNGHVNEDPKESVEDVVKEVESLLGVKIVASKDADLIDKGGMEEPQEPPLSEPMQESRSSDTQQQQLSPALVGDSAEPVVYREDVSSAAEDKGLEQESDVLSSAPPSTFQPNAQPTQLLPTMSEQQTVPDHPSVGIDSNDDALMGGMDLDLDDSNLQFDESNLDTAVDIPDPGESTTRASDEAPDGPLSETAQTESPAVFDVEIPPPPPLNLLPPTEPAEADGSAEKSAAAEATGADDGADSNLFHDSTFDDFTNMPDEGAADDDGGLIDFGTDIDAGMDDSAFGDALHGMEAHEGTGGEGVE